MSLRPIYVKASDAAPESLAPFGIRVKHYDDRGPFFKADHDLLWKGACVVRVLDDGRVVVYIAHHVTARERRICIGLAERAFEGGQAMCRHEKWERKRKTKTRKTPFYETYYWLRVTEGDRHHEALAAAISTPDLDIDTEQLSRVDGVARPINN